jgi:hypothetical protein
MHVDKPVVIYFECSLFYGLFVSCTLYTVSPYQTINMSMFSVIARFVGKVK